MRIIDAKLLEEQVKEAFKKTDPVLIECLLRLIRDQPTIDAVEVTRCRECKFGDWDSEPDDAMVCVRTKDGFWRSGNDFCSRGKRKEGVD